MYPLSNIEPNSVLLPFDFKHVKNRACMVEIVVEVCKTLSEEVRAADLTAAVA